MKHLKHINEMENWATPNRLGSGYDSVEEFIREYPIVTKNGSISVESFYKAVIELAARLYLSRYDIERIENNKELRLREYLIPALGRYMREYL